LEAAVQEAVFGLFFAFFKGHHIAAADASVPFDKDVPFAWPASALARRV
jgi:hypothetical protein